MEIALMLASIIVMQPCAHVGPWCALIIIIDIDINAWYIYIIVVPNVVLVMESKAEDEKELRGKWPPNNFLLLSYHKCPKRS